MKLSHWRRLPYVFHRVAHLDVDVARRCASRAIMLYVESAPNCRHHSFTNKLCRVGSQARRNMEAFIAGALLCDLPCLEWYAAQCMLVLVVERWIESRCGITNRMLARSPNAAASEIAWQMLYSYVTKYMGMGPLLNQVADAMTHTRNISEVLIRVGVLHHLL